MHSFKKSSTETVFMTPRSLHSNFAQGGGNFQDISGCIAVSKAAIRDGHLGPQDFALVQSVKDSADTADMVSLDTSQNSLLTRINLDQFRTYWMPAILNMLTEPVVPQLPLNPEGALYAVTRVTGPRDGSMNYKFKVRIASSPNDHPRFIKPDELFNRLHGPSMVLRVRNLQENARVREHTDRTRSGGGGRSPGAQQQPHNPQRDSRDQRQRHVSPRYHNNSPTGPNLFDQFGRVQSLTGFNGGYLDMSGMQDKAALALVKGFCPMDAASAMPIGCITEAAAAVSQDLAFKGRLDCFNDVRSWVDKMNRWVPLRWDINELMQVPCVMPVSGRWELQNDRVLAVQRLAKGQPTVRFAPIEAEQELAAQAEAFMRNHATVFGTGQVPPQGQAPNAMHAPGQNGMGQGGNPTANAFMGIGGFTSVPPAGNAQLPRPPPVNIAHLIPPSHHPVNMGGVNSLGAPLELGPGQDPDKDGFVAPEYAHISMPNIRPQQQRTSHMSVPDKEVAQYPRLCTIAPRGMPLSEVVTALSTVPAGCNSSAVAALKVAAKCTSESWGFRSLRAASIELEGLLETIFKDIEVSMGEFRTKAAVDVAGMLDTVAILLAKRQSVPAPTANNSSTPAPYEGHSRRAEMPTDDESKAIQGSAAVNIAALRVLQNDKAVKDWSTRYGTTAVKEPLPVAAVMFNMADTGSREIKGTMLPLEIKQCLDSDFVERAERVDTALIRRYGQFLNEKLQKRLKVNMLALRFSKLPKLIEMSGDQKATDTFGLARPTRSMSTGGASHLVYDLARAAFPEWSWQSLLVLSTEMSRMGEVSSMAMKLRMGTLWEEAMMKVQLACDRVRMGAVETTNGEIFVGNEFVSWVMAESAAADKGAADNDNAHAPFEARMKLLEDTIAKQSGKPPTPRASPGTGGQGLCYNITFSVVKTKWYDKFPNKCIHRNLMGVCKPPEGKSCDLNHDPVPVTETKAFVEAEGGTYKG